MKIEKYIENNNLERKHRNIDYVSEAIDSLSKFYPKIELLKTKKSYSCISCSGCLGCGSCCGDSGRRKYDIVPASHSCVGCSGCDSCVGS